MKIAVVGSGISGLSAAWLLSRAHEVKVFERAHWIGGHANTVEVTARDGTVAVDTGFIVSNTATYPNLNALFDHLSVPMHESPMSFAMSLSDGAYEYSGSGALGFFGQVSNAFKPRHWQLLRDIRRFFETARDAVATYPQPLSLGAFLRREKYSDVFVEDHILPMGAAIWSSSMRDMLSFPAASFISFYDNHGLMQFKDRPMWRTVKGGSREYVRRLVADGSFDVATNAQITKVRRSHDHVEITEAGKAPERFDHVVMAAHSDQSLDMLSDADAAEKAVLSRLRYQPNRAYLHRDPSFMPKRKRVWSSWNYLKAASGADTIPCVTYYMNMLQDLPTREDFFVTLNPPAQRLPEKIDAVFDYAHPVFDAEAMAAQTQLWGLQGRRRTWYCGAYFGYGFHEDGIQSGLAVAEALGGVTRPWTVANPSGRIHLPQPSTPYDIAAE